MIVAGTGHRPNKLGGYSDDAFSLLVLLAEKWLVDSPTKRVISGMALGWDQALAQAAYNLGIPFTAAIPFEGQEAAWPAKSKKYHHWLLAQAREVVPVCEPGYAAWKMQRRNEWMVDRADLLLALWDGTDGGTANCVRYATSRGVPVTNLYDDWKGDLHVD